MAQLTWKRVVFSGWKPDRGFYEDPAGERVQLVIGQMFGERSDGKFLYVNRLMSAEFPQAVAEVGLRAELDELLTREAWPSAAV